MMFKNIGMIIQDYRFLSKRRLISIMKIDGQGGKKELIDL